MIKKNQNPKTLTCIGRNWNYDIFQDEMQSLTKVLHLKKNHSYLKKTNIKKWCKLEKL
jgi:hypothetical protein